MVIAAVSYNAMATGGIDSLGFQGRDRRMGKLIAAQNGNAGTTNASRSVSTLEQAKGARPWNGIEKRPAKRAVFFNRDLRNTDYVDHPNRGDDPGLVEQR
jgi:hypothetical protein